MNNNNRNNNNNNRRRGRNNSRPQNGGGNGQQTNRIDSRARGNAPQMLEKYRKLAHDAHLNGDRVTSEYYLQFADHYFRVIADTRLRQEEARARRDERWQEGDAPYAEVDDAADFSVESDFPAFDQPPVYQKREREERPQREERGPREDRLMREPRREAPAVEAQEAPAQGEGQGDEGQAQRNPYEPVENPFLRDNRGSRGLRPRRDDRRPEQRSEPRGEPRSEQRPEPRAPRREAAPVRDEAPAPRPVAAAEHDAPTVALEASLPPALSIRRKPAARAVVDDAAPAVAAPKRRAPRRKAVSEDGEALESAG